MLERVETSDIIRDIHNAHPEINTLQLGYLREEIDRLQFFGIVRFAVDDGTHDLHKANDLILLKG